MNWGIRITLLYLGFMALILTLVFTCMSNGSELESKNYYAKELRFQEQIDAARRTAELKTPVSHRVCARVVQLLVPEELMQGGIKGSVQFVRPSDATQDRSVELMPDAGGVQRIGPGFAKGVYKMQLNYVSGGKRYYQEAVLNFN